MKRSQDTEWPALINAYLVHREDTLLDKAVAILTDRPDVLALLTAYRGDDFFMEVVGQVEAWLEAHAASTSTEERMALMLLRLDCLAALTEVFPHFPLEEQQERLEEGLRACREAIEVSLKANSTMCAAFYACRLGSGLASAHRLGEAVAAFRKALSLCRDLSAKDPGVYAEMMAEACTGLGNALADQGRYRPATKALKKALSLYRKLYQARPQKYAEDLALAWNNLGTVLAKRTQYKKAESALQKAYRLYRPLYRKQPEAYAEELAMVWRNLGTIYSDQARDEAAEKALRRAVKLNLELYEAQPQTYAIDLIMTLNNLGVVLSDQRKYRAAEKVLLKALKIVKQLHQAWPEVYADDLATTWINLGGAFSGQRRYVEAEHAYSMVLTHYQDLRRTQPAVYASRLAKAWRNYGTMHIDNMQYEKAETAHREALVIYQDLYDTQPETYATELTATWNQLGSVLLWREQYEEAIEAFQKALSLYQRIYPSQPQAYALDFAITCNNLGVLCSRQGWHEEAVEAFHAAKALCQQNYQTHPQRFGAEIAALWNNLGYVLDDQLQYEEAEAAYQHAIALDADYLYEGGLMARWGLGELYYAQHRLEESYTLWRDVLHAIESGRDRLQRKEDRALLHGQHVPRYERMVRLCLDLDRPTEAWHWAERGKARTLLDQLGNTRPRLETAEQRTLYDRWHQAEREAARLIYQLHALPATEEALSKQILVLQEKQTNAIKLRETLAFELGAASNRVAVQVPPPETLARHLQTLSAGERTLLVQYVLLDEDRYAVFLLPLWEVVPDRSLPLIADQVVVPPGKVEQLSKQLQAGLGALRRGNTGEADVQMGPLPEALGKALLQPWQHHLDQFQPDNVVLIPGGALHRMPLHAALLKNGQPLVERYPSLYLGSAAVAQTLAQRLDSAPRPTGRLVLGPPHPPKHPLYRERAHLEAAHLAAAWSAPHFALSQMRTEKLREWSGRLQIAHLTTHSHFDASDYLQSYLQFHQEHLTLFELISDTTLNFTGMRLCYLSSCASGTARVERSEDLQGLVWALMDAGVEAVMATLWPVEDYVSEWMARGFYRRMEEGKPLIEAYAETLDALRRERDFAHPLYWSPFVLFGNGFISL